MPPLLGTQDRPLRVAIVGSGPSAFYAADALFKRKDVTVRVDMFERLPTPFGLVRGGVAPDHQQVKGVAKMYDRTAQEPGFRFFGNVRVGAALAVAELETMYDATIFAVGNESDRRLDVPGEELAGVHSATEFVFWYNAHPDYAARRFDLERAERVAVFGNGNVAVDVARILLKDPRQLAETDIAPDALEALQRSRIKEVLLIGRRGPAQAAFSLKEVKELAELDGVAFQVSKPELAEDPATTAWLAGAAPAGARKIVEFLSLQCAAAEHRAGTEPSRRLVCRFLRAPVEFVATAGRLGAVRLEVAELVADAQGTPRPRGTGRIEEIAVQLAFKAIGYRGVPLEGVAFDERRGHIPNLDGRVLDTPGGAPVRGRYVVGWAKRGPTGLLGSNNPDSKATVEALLADLASQPAAPLAADDAQRIVRALEQRGIEYVTFDGWKRIDAREQELGRQAGKIREKLTSLAECLRLAGGR